MKAFLSTVALLLAFGVGVWGYTPERIAEWKEAAENGDAKAQYNLGRSYYNFFREGVIEDKIQSYAWFNIAAANGYENAKKKKSVLVERMTKEQIAEAEKLSTEMVEANPKLINYPPLQPPPKKCSLNDELFSDLLKTHYLHLRKFLT